MKNNYKCLVCHKPARIDPDTNQQSEYCSKKCQKQAVKLKLIEACKICESYPKMLECGQRVEWCSLDCKKFFMEENPNYKKPMKAPNKVEKLTYKMNKVKITTDYDDNSPPPSYEEICGAEEYSKKVPEKIKEIPSLNYYPKSIPTNIPIDFSINEKSSISNMDFKNDGINDDMNQINHNTNNISQVNKNINQNRNPNNRNPNRNLNNQRIPNNQNSNNRNPAVPNSQNYQHQSPANQIQSPAVQHQSPAIQQQSLVIQQRSPVIQQQSPVIQQRNPVIRQQSPVMRQPSPVIRQRSPVIQQQSPAIQQPNSDIKLQSPAIQQQSSGVQKQSSVTQQQNLDTPTIQEDSDTKFNEGEGENVISYAAPHQPVIKKSLPTLPQIVYTNPQPIYVNNPVINPVNAYTMQPIISQTSAGDVVYFNNNRAISSTSQIQSKVAPALLVATPQLVNQIQPVKQNVVMAQHPIQQQHMQTIQQQQIQPSQMFVNTPYTVPTYVVNNANGKNMIQTQPYQQQIPIPQSYQQQMPIPQSYQQQIPIPQSYQQQIPIPQSYQQQIPIPQSYQQQIPIQQPYQQPIPIPQPYQQRIQNQSQNRSLNQPPY